MKKIICCTTLSFVILFIACSRDDSNENLTERSNKKKIENLIFLSNVNENLDKDFEANIDENKNEITVNFPSGTDVTNLIPNITISVGALVKPGSLIPIDLTTPKTYEVTGRRWYYSHLYP